ncbi:hypothetical protein Barb4_00642 [Bacteroidales bacterium Barb4]|nr:hypothetical protein Barb4_00642 [Bacteroidales bacterium Barb4]
MKRYNRIRKALSRYYTMESGKERQKEVLFHNYFILCGGNLEQAANVAITARPHKKTQGKW